MKNLMITGVLLLVLFLSSAFCSSALAEMEPEGEAEHAQRDRGSRRGPNLDRRLTRMQKNLQLSDEQADKIYNIFKSSKKNKGSCRDLQSFSERKNCKMVKRDKVRSEVSEVLTEEQQKKWEKNHDKFRDEMKLRRDKKRRRAGY